jgi:acyl-CoA thioester hydrolase
MVSCGWCGVGRREPIVTDRTPSGFPSHKSFARTLFMQLPDRVRYSLRTLQRFYGQRRSCPKPTDYALLSSEKLRFADTDRNGHVSNAVFAVCCQNGRMELLTDASRLPLPPDAHFVVRRLDLEFRGELHWPGTVHVGTKVVALGRSSADLAQALFVDDRCVAVSKSTVVLIADTTRRPIPLSTELAARLRIFCGPPPPSIS